jgi:hypothetical protein
MITVSIKGLDTAGHIEGGSEVGTTLLARKGVEWYAMGETEGFQ